MKIEEMGQQQSVVKQGVGVHFRADFHTDPLVL